MFVFIREVPDINRSSYQTNATVFKMMKLFICLAFIAFSTVYTLPNYYESFLLEDGDGKVYIVKSPAELIYANIEEENHIDESENSERKKSIQPGSRVLPDNFEVNTQDKTETDDSDSKEEEGDNSDNIKRQKRSVQPLPQQQLPSSVGGNIQKQGANTIATINAQHKTEEYEVGATWRKVVDGPGRSKPTFNVGGAYRW